MKEEWNVTHPVDNLAEEATTSERKLRNRDQESWTEEAAAFVRKAVEEAVGIELPFAVQTQADSGLTVRLKDGKGEIRAESLNALGRGYFLLSRAVREDRKELNVHQDHCFRDCGSMLDMSRNGVMTVDAVKRYLRMQSCLGMNFLMLYTEDTYEIPEYPSFGYLRGRYTQAELKEIDNYAAKLGIEMIPCIQTLAHMQQFLQWGTVPKDQPDILLIDEEETYHFLEAAIRSLRACFRSKRIHIGMDEAMGVGLGRYLKEHGYTDHFQMLNRHLGRVAEICEKYEFAPMMWSDMFFRLGSKSNGYYDLDNHVPDEVIATLPKVQMVYWDYYHTEEEFFTRMLREHARMGRGTIFAGGNWMWSGFLPQLKKTEATMRPGLRAAAREQIDMVIATMWADDGAETDHFLAAGMLPLFSEACWQGAECPDTEWRRMSEMLTGLPWEVYSAFGDAYGDAGEAYSAKRMIWGDPLYPLGLFQGDDPDRIIARCEKARECLKPWLMRDDCAWADRVLALMAKKAFLMSHLRNWYIAGDRTALTDVRDRRIPEIMDLTAALRDMHRTQWEKNRKRFGWETMALRYGATMGRLEDVQWLLDRYLRGEIQSIEELDAEPQVLELWQHYHQLAAPTVIL